MEIMERLLQLNRARGFVFGTGALILFMVINGIHTLYDFINKFFNHFTCNNINKRIIQNNVFNYALGNFHIIVNSL